MRIISGTAGGIPIAVPRSLLRPTADRVREAVFSILHPRMAGARFLDLYAGSGANGIEALSRGAAMCAFVDVNADAIRTVDENLDRAKLKHKSRSYRLTIPAALGVVAEREDPFDIVFCDPPYDTKDYELLLTQIQASKLLAADGLVLIEHESKLELPDVVAALRCTRKADYGRVRISFFA